MSAQDAVPDENLPPPTFTVPSAVAPLPQNNSIEAPVPTPGSNRETVEPLRLQGPVPSPNPASFTVRVKDITRIDGYRSHRVEGMGLVTGLQNTGGKSPGTLRVAKSFFQNQGLLSDVLATQSLSVVFVSAEIPPFYRAGEKIIATVSVMDDASSLYGGVLLSTPLKGIDGQYYALAGGPLEIGGFSISGQGGALRKNHVTVGKVEAQVEEEFCDGPKLDNRSFRLNLKNKDYTTAYRIAVEINKYFPQIARASDGGSVDVLIPNEFAHSPVDFVVMIQNLRIEPDNTARVVINEKTGTIIAGRNVKLSSFMFAKDNLIISIVETPVASQPAPFSQGETAILPRSQLDAVQNGSRYNLLPANITVGELANVLNQLGVPPQDIISVFLALEQEGSLQAELKIE